MNDPSGPQRSPRQSRPSHAWPVAFALVALATVIASVVAVWLVLRSGERAGEAVLNSGARAARELERIASSFRTGRIRTEFASFATTVVGETRLQFASLDQTEVLRREEEASLLWGQLPLPTVVVEATAPVHYTYFVDLEGEWNFRLDGDSIAVTAPSIGHNPPAVDPSAIRFDVRQDSLLRDERAVAENLRRVLGPMLESRAEHNTELVREVGRRKIKEFVETWLFRDFGEASRRYTVEVTFADEDSDQHGPAIHLEHPRN